MADTVATRIVFQGSRRYVALLTNLSDGTGENAALKVDISSLQGAPSAVKIEKVKYSINGMTVAVLFDHTDDDAVLYLSGEGCMDFMDYGGLRDPASAGGPGDILFTTFGASANASYSILLYLALS